ncbi:MAG: PQQ-dependent sugar dehydrogenase [Alphaproteobacteria bacterium]
MRGMISALAAAILVTGSVWAQEETETAKTADAAAAEKPYVIETVAEGLHYPWSLAFLPGGGMLVTERDGRLRLIRGGELVEDPVTGVPPVYVESQAGLFDVTLHPQFALNKMLFLAYAHGDAGANNTRVARARFDEEALELKDLEVIFEAEPLKDTPVHYGGRMTFLPDGTLLVTLGDGFEYREQAQVLSNHLGAIVRLNPDGSVPGDNPFTDREDAKPEIWSYGHRNVQAVLYDPDTGRIYAHEHGAKGGDEINIIEKGKNYGWPLATHGIDYSGAYITPWTEFEGTEQPLLHWTPSIAPSGMTLYRGRKFPQWDGDFLVSALAARKVQRVDMENGEVTGQEALFEELGARIRDVRTGPDGSVYLLTDAEPTEENPEGGKVLRVRPKE